MNLYLWYIQSIYTQYIPSIYTQYIPSIYTQYILYIFSHVVVQRSLGLYQLDLVTMAYMNPLQNSSFSSRSYQTSTKHHLSTDIGDIQVIYTQYILYIFTHLGSRPLEFPLEPFLLPSICVQASSLVVAQHIFSSLCLDIPLSMHGVCAYVSLLRKICCKTLVQCPDCKDNMSSQQPQKAWRGTQTISEVCRGWWLFVAIW